jgi:hypothetical protein
MRQTDGVKKPFDRDKVTRRYLPSVVDQMESIQKAGCLANRSSRAQILYELGFTLCKMQGTSEAENYFQYAPDT